MVANAGWTSRRERPALRQRAAEALHVVAADVQRVHLGHDAVACHNAAVPSWSNWAGNVTCRRGRLRGRRPRRRAAARRRRSRGAGRGGGHSFSPLCATDGLLLDLAALAGVTSVDAERGLATVRRARASPTWASRSGPPASGSRTRATSTRRRSAVRSPPARPGSGRSAASRRSCGRPRSCCRAATSSADRCGLALGLFGVIVSLELAVVPAYRLHERSGTAPTATPSGSGRRPPTVLATSSSSGCRCSTGAFSSGSPQHRRAVGNAPPPPAAARQDRTVPEPRARRLEPPHLPVRARHTVHRDRIRGAGRVGVRDAGRRPRADARAPAGADMGGRVPRPGRRRPTLVRRRVATSSPSACMRSRTTIAEGLAAAERLLLEADGRPHSASSAG